MNRTSDQPVLERTLTRFDATMIVMGTIIGIGIFFTPGRVAAATQSPLLSLAAWSLGGLVAVAGAFTFAQLGLLLPHAGGPYVYLSKGIGPWCGFLYGWMTLMAIVSGAIAAIGHTLAHHLARFFPMTESVQQVVAAVTILSLTAVNIVGVRWGSRVQNIFTVLKIVSLLLLVGVGLWKGSESLAGSDVAAQPGSSGAVEGAWAIAILSGMVGVLFSYGGWQNLNNVASELRDTRRDLPRAIVIGVVSVVVLYLLANLAYFKLLPTEQLASSRTPAADALEVAVGSAAGDVAALLILCSAFGIVNGLLLSQPRVYYAMARDGLLFRPFAAVHAKFRTPAVAIGVQGLVASLFAFVGDIGALLDYVVFADWIFFSLGGVALFLIRRRLGAEAPAFRSLGHPWTPMLYTVCASVMAVSVLVLHWENTKVGVWVLLLGACIYLVMRRSVRARTRSDG